MALNIETGHLPVGSGHEIYWERSGNPTGKPIIYLHGGPGGHSKPDHRELFDPNHWQIILFDQRGCGQSRPLGSLEDNNTFALVEDIEKLKEHLGLGQVTLYGSSWGTTLALAYAITYPQNIAALVLRGIFLGTKKELDWFHFEGPKQFYPKEWDRWLTFLPEDERGDPLKGYAKRLISGDIEAAKEWNRFELTCCRLNFDPSMIEEILAEDPGLTSAKVETHYFQNQCFFPEEDWILNRCSQIAHIPTTLIHGRYDMVCPLRSAYLLHNQLPNSELLIVQEGGHATSEPGMESTVTDALTKLTP